MILSRLGFPVSQTLFPQIPVQATQAWSGVVTPVASISHEQIELRQRYRCHTSMAVRVSAPYKNRLGTRSRHGFSTELCLSKKNIPSSSRTHTLHQYVTALRPITIIQAVGGFIVGSLTAASPCTTVLSKPGVFLAAIVSIYVSYGAGMVINDAVDVDIDSLSKNYSKNDRPIASGRISRRAAWFYCAGLSGISLLLGSCVSSYYSVWTTSNLAFMLAYAFGLQKVVIVKNVICGWLAISPLIGSWIFSGMQEHNRAKLLSLALVGFLMHVSREIVKDIEDVDIDRGNKLTLPVLIGEKTSHRIAYGLVAMTYAMNIFTPTYWNIFACKLPLYPLSIIITLPMCIRASLLPISEGQRLLKKSIYVLLAGMIGALSL